MQPMPLQISGPNVLELYLENKESTIDRQHERKLQRDKF